MLALLWGFSQRLQTQEVYFPLDRSDRTDEPVVRELGSGSQPPAFRLMGGEFLASGLQRVSLEQLDFAIAALQEFSLEIGIHEARKAMRRVRAVLRLVRDPLGFSVYRAENAALRDIGRVIGGSRDATVLVETVQGLSLLYDGVLDADAFGDLLHHLRGRDELIRRRITAYTVNNVVVDLQAARTRFASWPRTLTAQGATTDDFEAVRLGIRRVYRRGRRRLVDAAHHPTAEAHHVWRKRVRYLRFQMELLEGMWPRMQQGLASDLAHLADVLGAEHDLAMLEAVLRSEPAMLPDPAARQVLTALVARNRVRLQRAAQPVGRRVFAEAPNLFVDRLETYWRVWRSATAEAIRPPSAAWIIRTDPSTAG